MKTTNNAQKTGNRKFSKTLAAVLVLFFISYSSGSHNVSNHRVKKNTFDKTAQLMIKQKSGINAPLDMAKTIDYMHSAETEKELPELFNETEQEEKLELESWMISNKYFSRAESLFSEEIEEPLNIEEWMTDNKYWGF